MRFKPGDIVIGNKLCKYSVTKTGTKWKVLEVVDAEVIKIGWIGEPPPTNSRSYYVDADKFDLYRHKDGKPYYPSWF